MHKSENTDVDPLEDVPELTMHPDNSDEDEDVVID